jgi:hypothetical protein
MLQNNWTRQGRFRHPDRPEESPTPELKYFTAEGREAEFKSDVGNLLPGVSSQSSRR